MSQNKSDDNKNSKLIDELIDKMGITSYTLRVCTIIYLFNLADGGEIIVISLITTTLGELWNLSHAEKGLLGSSVFVGVFIGVLISGKISDNFGRKPSFIIGSVISTIFAILSAFSFNISSLLVFRTLFGLGIGIMQTPSTAMATEIAPKKWRIYILNANAVFFVLGEVTAVTVGRNVLDIENGWRILLAVVGVISLFSTIVSLFILESPRYYIASKQYEKAFSTLEQILNYSVKVGEDRVVLTDEMMNRIKEEESLEIEANYSSLCDKRYFKLTIMISLIFLIVSYCYYGLMYILPQLLVKNDVDPTLTKAELKSRMYNSMVISSLIGIPGIMFFSFVSNTKFFGRKKSISLGFICSAITCIFAIFFISYLYILAPILRLSIGLSFCIIYIYVSEAYPTKIRSISLGFSNSFNRIGGITTPFLTQLIYSVYRSGPFIVFGIISAIGFILSILLPFETLNRDID